MRGSSRILDEVPDRATRESYAIRDLGEIPDGVTCTSCSVWNQIGYPDGGTRACVSIRILSEKPDRTTCTPNCIRLRTLKPVT